MNKLHLAVIPAVSVWKEGEFLIFDRKFYDGMSLYSKYWPGKVTCIISSSKSNLPSFGIVKAKAPPFKCIVLEDDQRVGIEHLSTVSTVLASGDSNDQLHISKLCKTNNIKCIYIIELIPETRYQIVSLNTPNTIIKLRRFFYIWNAERKRLAAFSQSTGLQINGTAAYAEYKEVDNKLLYFDNRMNSALIIKDKELENRFHYLSRNKPLRLAFSGNLSLIKGADHLVLLGKLLKQRNIPFSLTIYGTGDCEEYMKNFIKSENLSDKIFLVGPVDFYKELVPNIKQKTDIFVCLHRQGDPSCTYIETLACGVPIIGYKNKAFEGILERAEVGWGVELNNLDGIVDVIQFLSTNRDEISNVAQNAISFASIHDFESTFKNRIDHLLELTNQRVD